MNLQNFTINYNPIIQHWVYMTVLRLIKHRVKLTSRTEYFWLFYEILFDSSAFHWMLSVLNLLKRQNVLWRSSFSCCVLRSLTALAWCHNVMWPDVHIVMSYPHLRIAHVTSFAFCNRISLWPLTALRYSRKEILLSFIFYFYGFITEVEGLIFLLASFWLRTDCVAYGF